MWYNRYIIKEGELDDKEITKEKTTLAEGKPSEIVTEKTTIAGPKKPIPGAVSQPHKETHLIYYLVGLIEILLATRFVLRLLGANPLSGFVDAIYLVSRIFVFPFQAIFGRVTAPGAETASVFEPDTLIAMIFYAVVGWGIVRFKQIMSGRAHQKG